MPITKVWLTSPEEDIVGFVTPVLINNDGFHEIHDNPVKFVNDISEKMNYGGNSAMGFAEILMAHHSSEFHVYVTKHTRLIDIDRYDQNFKKLCADNPKYAKDLLDDAKKRINESIKYLKKLTEEKTNE